MIIQELLDELGLLQEEIDLLLSEMKDYNKLHRNNMVPALELKESIDQILITQIPFIGRAIAKIRNEHYLDITRMYPLRLDENATRYAMHKLEKYYRKPKMPKDGHPA